MLMDVNDATDEIQFNNLSNGSITGHDQRRGGGRFPSRIPTARRTRLFFT
jgi:hypothetical protein